MASPLFILHIWMVQIWNQIDLEYICLKYVHKLMVLVKILGRKMEKKLAIQKGQSHILSMNSLPLLKAKWNKIEF